MQQEGHCWSVSSRHQPAQLQCVWLDWGGRFSVNFRTGFLFAVAAVLCAPAQESASFRSGPGGFSGVARFPRLPHIPSAISGAPYSAEQVHESVQVLADGTRITRKMPSVKMYRDSDGRMRTERKLFAGPIGSRQPQGEPPEIVEIMDPVANVRIILDVKNRTAHRQQFAQPARVIPAASGPPSIPSGPGFESLGSRLIEGVMAEGSRTTRTVAAGEQGNDRPIVTTHETWFSPELRIGIMFKSSDPRSGENTMRMTNVSRFEQEAALFQVPPGYRLVEEKDEIVLRWGESN